MVLAVVRRGQEREVLGDAVRRDVHADYSRRASEEVNAVADVIGDIVIPADHPYRNVCDIVIRTPAIWPARLVRAQRGTQPTLLLGSGRRHAQVEPQ